MSKVSFPFDLIPKIFRKKGILDPRKKNYLKRLAFIYWAFSKCYTVSTVQEGVSFQPFEFCVGIQQAIKESGLNLEELEAQFRFFVDQGFLIKSKNEVKNRPNHYRWNTHKFLDDKLIELSNENELEKNPDQNSSEGKEKIRTESEKIRTEIVADSIPSKPEIKNPDQLREENDENIRTNIKKSGPKSGPNPDQLREENSKKSGPNPDQHPPSIETNRTIEAICLKETKKEIQPVAETKNAEDLFLSHKENEQQEHQKAIEAYIEFRNIKSISSKTITRWLVDYPIDDIIGALGLLISNDHKKPENPGGWVQTALKEGWPKQERIKKQNFYFVTELKEKNKLRHLKINSRYCVDQRAGKDYYYHIDPKIFEAEIRKCL
jgi:ribulose bisphosphate carboxylase small subunit